MASTTSAFTVFADDAGIGTVAWVNPTDAGASDDVRAHVDLTGTAISHYLKFTSPTGVSIPAGATINGIEFTVERSVATGTIKDYRMRAVKGDAIGSTDQADTGTAWPATTDANKTYGSSVYLWGDTWLDTDFGAGFGFAIAVQKSAGKGIKVARIDYATVTIHYTAAAGGGSNAAMLLASD